MKLKFSIIVPVFNGEAYIEKALINLVRIRKNCQEIEVIIVDDGSVDNTRKICLNYIENNIWIKLYSKKKWWGFFSAQSWLGEGKRRIHYFSR